MVFNVVIFVLPADLHFVVLLSVLSTDLHYVVSFVFFTDLLLLQDIIQHSVEPEIEILVRQAKKENLRETLKEVSKRQVTKFIAHLDANGTMMLLKAVCNASCLTITTRKYGRIDQGNQRVFYPPLVGEGDFSRARIRRHVFLWAQKLNNYWSNLF